MELGIPGDLGARYLYGVKPYREIIEQGFIWSYEYQEIMGLVVYMELSPTGRSWS